MCAAPDATIFSHCALLYVLDCIDGRFRPMSGVQKSEDVVETLRQSESGRRRGTDARCSHVEAGWSGDQTAVVATFCTWRWRNMLTRSELVHWWSIKVVVWVISSKQGLWCCKFVKKINAADRHILLLRHSFFSFIYCIWISVQKFWILGLVSDQMTNKGDHIK